MSSLDTQDPTRAARRASAVAASAGILGRAGARRKVLLWVAQTMPVSVQDPDGSHAAQRHALAAALTNDVTVYVIDPRGNTGGAEDPDDKRSGGTLRVGGSTMSLEVERATLGVPLHQRPRPDAATLRPTSRSFRLRELPAHLVMTRTPTSQSSCTDLAPRRRSCWSPAASPRNGMADRGSDA